MSLNKGATLRKVIPASVVVAVLAFAYIAPLPASASKVNNCGVKGGYAYGGYAFAFHDHGKPCPNRPFPGKGKGVMKFLITGFTATPATTPDQGKSQAASKSSTTPKSSTTSKMGRANSAAVDATVDSSSTQVATKSHGHSKVHARGQDNL